MSDPIAVLAFGTALYALWRTCETKTFPKRESKEYVDLFPHPKASAFTSTEPIFVKVFLEDTSVEVRFRSYLRMDGTDCILKLDVPMTEHWLFCNWHNAVRSELETYSPSDLLRATVLAANANLDETVTGTRRYTNVNLKFNRVLLHEIHATDPSAETFTVDLRWESYEIEPQNL